MSFRRTAQILLAILVIVPTAAAQDGKLWVGPNVNMVSGTTFPDGDPFLQRQNEPSIAVSTRNTMHLVGFANDYRSVDIPRPAEGKTTRDSWLGVFKSLDGGSSWKSTLLPGYPQEDWSDSPIWGYEAAADPVVRAGTHGMFYLSGIVFDRGEGARSAVFVSRYADLNNLAVGDPIEYLDTAIVRANAPGAAFIDKPWMAVDIPRTAVKRTMWVRQGYGEEAQEIECGNIYLAWAEIYGPANDLRSDIVFTRSTDCAVTWDLPIVLSDPDTLNQGATIAVSPVDGSVWVAWRQFDVDSHPCVYEQEEWKDLPPADWPLQEISFCDDVYTAEEAMDLLNTKHRGDITIKIAHESITAQLNVATTMDGEPIQDTIFAADGYTCDNPIGSKPKGKAKKEGMKLWKALRNYNRGKSYSKSYLASDGDDDDKSVGVPRVEAAPCSDTPGPDNAIIATRSTNAGLSFSLPALVAAINPFEQGTTPYSFRTNAYPTMTVDNANRAYLAWTVRGMAYPRSDTVEGDARIVVSTSQDGYNWTLPEPIPVDRPEVPGHQIQPTINYVSDRLFLAYYDFRKDFSGVFDRFVADMLSADQPYRHTVDVRVAVAEPGEYPVFTDYSIISGSDPAEIKRPSSQASKYLFMPTMHGEPAVIIFEQLEHNPPNLPMFKAGSVPFFGDYIDIAGSLPFVPDGQGDWTFNTSSTSAATAHVIWTDNRDVVAAPDGDWVTFVPPGDGGTSVFDGATDVSPCNPITDDVDRTQIRNQNIYTAKVTNGLTVSVPGNSRPLNDAFTRGFVIFVQNDTNVPRYFRLEILDRPDGGAASFDQFDPNIWTTEVAIERYASASKTVFATSTDATASIRVQVSEIDSNGGIVVGGLQSMALINPDPSNPGPADPSLLTGEIHTPAVFNPAVYNPAVYNPAVFNPAVFNPAVFNPAVFNPAVFNDAVLNYNVENPAVFNPAVFNPAVFNPAVFNPAVFNMAVMNPAVFNPAVLNPAVFNPAVFNPAVFNPAVFNPAVFNPAVLNPAVLNPAVFNPAVFNPAVLNPAVFNPAVLNPAVFNTTFADESATDFNLVAENRGNATSSYTVNLALNSDPPGFKYQLLIYRLYFTPVVDQCTVTEAAHQELLVNDLDPDMHANLLDEGENSFYLDPGDQAVITLRILPDPYDPNPGDPSEYPLDDVSGSVVADKENTNDEADGDDGGDVSTFLGSSVPPINVTSSPTPPDATEGEPYSFTFTATGGTGPLTWSFAPGSTPPPGLTLTPTGLLSGSPLSPGSFVFSVQVTDSSTQIVIQTVSLTVNASPMIPLAQRNALIALYNSTNGDGWTDKTGWKTGGVPSPRGSECSWFGVTCGSPKVDWIDLSYNNLNGPIPIEIGSLVDLRGLNLESNLLIGQIPDQIGNLVNLEDLHLANNQLTGAIPPQLADAANLRWMHVGDNQLSGAIPLQIGNLSNLQFIYLQRNNLTGLIPTGIGNLSNLESLNLSSNQLAGPIPPQFGNLIALKWLNLNYNQLSGTIPPQLGNIGTLQSLALYGNQLIGTIPEEIGDFALLNYLNLGNNQLIGIIPADLGDLSNLEMLILDNNQLSGLIPAQLGNLPKLIYLNLQFNLLAGPIPTALSNLSSLKQMLLSQNQLSGGIPESLGDLDQLEVLSLSSNLLTGTIPLRLTDPPNLVWLALGANQLSGSIPVEVGGITNLRYLGLPFNQLSGTIPSELGNLGSLEYLYLNGNQLSGTIPPQLGNLGSLQELLLDQNQITGSIPSQLEDLSNLVFLGLGNNRISGAIPMQIANLTNLMSLRLEGNKLEGPIPTNFDNLVNLQDNNLDIRWNALLNFNPALTAFLDSKQDGGDWLSTQTVPTSVLNPGGAVTESSVSLTWLPITYTTGGGGYEVLYSATPGGPYVVYPLRTADKTVNTITVDNLHPGIKYYFAIRSITDPHSNNQNTVVSTLSAETEDTTASPLTITNSAPLDGAVGLGYSHLLLAGGGTPPYSWSLVPGSGELPPGLTIIPTGDINGVPLTPGTYTFSVRVTDGALSGEATYTMSIAPPGGGVVFFEQPGLATAGRDIPNFSVKVVDGVGTPVPGVPINLSIASDPCGSATLSPLLPSAMTGPNGIATFSGISIDRGGFGFTFLASTGGGAPSSAISEQYGLIGYCETDAMSSTRVGATMTRLRDGRMLVAGGATRVGGTSTPLATSEIYDPSTGTWSATGDLVTARSLHTATLLQDGRVLIAGGSSSALPAAGTSLDSAEIFDPAGAGTFSSIGNMTVPRMRHTTTLLKNGTVLIAGGRDTASAASYLDSAEVFNTGGGGTFTAIADPMTTPRDGHRAVRLNDGRVLLVGGLSAPSTSLDKAEVFDLDGLGGAGEFTAVGNMSGPRVNHTATVLDDGRVLVAGDSTAEIFNPDIGTGIFESTNRLSPARDSHQAVSLDSGKTLVTGGKIGSPYPSLLWATSDLFDVSADEGRGDFEPSHQMRWRRSLHLMETFANSDVLVAGGMSYAGQGIADAEIYWPIEGQSVFTQQIGSPSGDLVYGVAGDATGVYVVGLAQGALPGVSHLGGSDGFIWKFNTSGVGIWNDQFGTSTDDYARGVAVGNTGVFIVGYTIGTMPGESPAGARDVFIRKESFAAGELWTRQFGTTGNDHGHAIAVDPSGVYVVGQTSGALPTQSHSGGFDAFIRKYDELGTEIWTRQFGTAGDDTLDGVAVDSSGVYVSGYVRGALPGQTAVGDADAFVRKYDFNGNEVWTRQFGSTGFDDARSIAVNAIGVFVAGPTDGTLPGQTSSGGYDAFVRAYDFGGNELWTHQFGSIDAQTDNATGIVADDSGIFVLGYTHGELPGRTSWGSVDTYIRKYDHGGDEVWTRQIGGPGVDAGNSICLSESGLYIGGRTTGELPGQSSAGGDDGFFLKVLQ